MKPTSTSQSQLRPAEEKNVNPAWQRQDTAPNLQSAVDWRPFLTRLIATLQQLNDPGLNDEQRVQGLETLVRELGGKLGLRIEPQA
ncbi:MAG: hypothetical protein QM723_07200 [Myxococcaceae bacterium]